MNNTMRGDDAQHGQWQNVSKFRIGRTTDPHSTNPLTTVPHPSMAALRFTSRPSLSTADGDGAAVPPRWFFLSTSCAMVSPATVITPPVATFVRSGYALAALV